MRFKLMGTLVFALYRLGDEDVYRSQARTNASNNALNSPVR
jgi:hypothetical protein